MLASAASRVVQAKMGWASPSGQMLRTMQMMRSIVVAPFICVLVVEGEGEGLAPFPLLLGVEVGVVLGHGVVGLDGVALLVEVEPGREDDGVAGRVGAVPQVLHVVGVLTEVGGVDDGGLVGEVGEDDVDDGVACHCGGSFHFVVVVVEGKGRACALPLVHLERMKSRRVVRSPWSMSSAIRLRSRASGWG